MKSSLLRHALPCALALATMSAEAAAPESAASGTPGRPDRFTEAASAFPAK